MLQQQMQGGIFQSTLPTRGSDPSGLNKRQISRNFNPRSPRGGATRSCSSTVGGIVGFQSTLPTRGSDIVLIAQGIKAIRISIHAPHEGERRYLCQSIKIKKGKISIHAPHEGERLTLNIIRQWSHIFQSTLPTRGSDSDSGKRQGQP